MKRERRISNSVLLICLAAMMLALVALWFGWRTPRNPTGEVTIGPETLPVTGESNSAVVEAATAPADQAKLRGEVRDSVSHEGTRTNDAIGPTVESESRASVQPGQTMQGTPGGAVLQGHVRFATPPADGENLTIRGQLSSFVPEMPTFRNSDEYKAFMFSPETQARIKAAKLFEVLAGEDGSIFLDSVPPGTYTLSLWASKPTERPRYFTDTAVGSANVIVPEGADPRSPIQLDEIVLLPVVRGRPVFR